MGQSGSSGACLPYRKVKHLEIEEEESEKRVLTAVERDRERFEERKRDMFSKHDIREKVVIKPGVSHVFEFDNLKR